MDPAVDTPLLVERLERSKFEPDHHVTIPATASTSFFPSWGSQATTNHTSLRFRNPWPSWHNPTRAQVWEHLQWGEDQDTTIQLATSHLDNLPTPAQPPSEKQRPRFGDIKTWPGSIGTKATRLLGIQEPDFSFALTSQNVRAKVTWLGHASMLVQFPPLDTMGSSNTRPIRCLFDPMFSIRCSPHQSAGPVRSYPPPCDVDTLPTIDAVFISHNHYDHLDYDTIMAIWKQNKDVVRFFVPLGNKRLFIEYGIRENQVTEMDWWECATLTPQKSCMPTKKMKIWCTPAQHNSSRFGVEANSTLWSSWYVEYCDPDSTKTPYRVFFAGDTGYQFHASPSWPPSPSSDTDTKENKSIDEPDETFPACPAFAEISERLGAPNLLLMPIWVGATFSYLRSLVPLPDWMSPFPRHAVGLAAANHMPPWDAVKVVKLMTDRNVEPPPSQSREGKKGRACQTIAIAMHWGTFVTDPVEIFKTLGQLEWACKQQGVRFARSLPGSKSEGGDDEPVADETKGRSEQDPYFLALNHGQSVYT